jgi:multidrug efflux pump subunit AcrA (membrane-fusion protein)
MSRNKKILVGLGVVVVLGGIAFANVKYKRQDGIVVNVETIQKRDLQAIVSASGKIQPQRLVNISADTMGRVTDLAVEEGQSVQKGQFLLQIDPRNLTTAYNQGAASLAAARSQMEQLRVSIDGTKTSLKQAQEALTRQQQFVQAGAHPKETLENAENLVRCAQSDLSSQERQIETQRLRMTQEEASLENAKLNLSKVRIESPITGIITRRNIEEGRRWSSAR